MTWEQIYDFFGIKEAIYFISSSEIQDYLFPVKLIFVFFAAFFLAGVIYFMINSSWLHFKFLEDVFEFLAWQSHGERELIKHWAKIRKRLESGVESDLKLAIIEADDFFTKILIDAGFDEDNVLDSIKNASKFFSNSVDEIIAAHEVRNSIVYNPDYKLSVDQAKKIIDTYEVAANNVGVK